LVKNPLVEALRELFEGVIRANFRNIHNGAPRTSRTQEALGIGTARHVQLLDLRDGSPLELRELPHQGRESFQDGRELGLQIGEERHRDGLKFGKAGRDA
jgi:hypothetical protein